MKMRMRRIRVGLNVAFLVGAASVCLALEKSIALDDLAYNHSELIVSGKVTEIKQSTTNQVTVVGVIQVETMLYGPRDTKHLLLSVQSRVGDHGNSYQVGDSGIWFLRRLSEAEPDVYDPPIYGLDVSNAVFEAEHSSTFWPDHPVEFMNRKGAGRPKMTPKEQAWFMRYRAERMRQLLSLIKKRLESDLLYFQQKRESAVENLKLIDGIP